MPFTLRPSQNKTLQLAYALMAAEERKAKKATKQAEPAEPVKKTTNRRSSNGKRN